MPDLPRTCWLLLHHGRGQPDLADSIFLDHFVATKHIVSPGIIRKWAAHRLPRRRDQSITDPASAASAASALASGARLRRDARLALSRALRAFTASASTAALAHARAADLNAAALWALSCMWDACMASSAVLQTVPPTPMGDSARWPRVRRGTPPLPRRWRGSHGTPSRQPWPSRATWGAGGCSAAPAASGPTSAGSLPPSRRADLELEVVATVVRGFVCSSVSPIGFAPFKGSTAHSY